MLTPRKAWRRLLALARRRQLDEELDTELTFHLTMEEEQQRARGADPAEARRRARVAFGPVQGLREATRDARGTRALDDLVRDVRHGLRTLAARPGFTAVVLLTLGVGVGGSAAIYGAVDAILLTPLPYPEADRVLGVWQTQPSKGIDRLEPSPANFLDWRDRARSFRHLTAMEPFGLNWQADDGPVYLNTYLVYENFFETFGAPPLLGRTPREDEHQRGQSPVIVLGFGAWQRHFGGDPAAVGRVLTIGGQPTTVIGVMPEGFAIPSDDVVWAPKVQQGWERQARGATYYTVFGRLADGVGRAEAQAELDIVAQRLEEEYPRVNGGMGITTVPLPEQIVGEARGAMLLLLGAVGMVLLIVVANVASLQLARAASREREFAVRGALGAGRGRVTRQLIAENLILAVLGTGLGFAVARGSLALIRSLTPAGFPRVTELRADGDVLGFAAVVSVLAVLAAGALPARLSARRHLGTSLVEGGRTATGNRGVDRLQSGLVVLQVCFSLVLLVGAGLLTRSFMTVLSEERGFRTDGVVTFTVQSWSFYRQPADRVNFVRDVVERMRSLPGVKGAGMISAIPLAEAIGAEHSPLTIDGMQLAEAGEPLPLVRFAVVSPGALEALGVELRRGRGFDSRDQNDGAPVALVNEAFASRYFGGAGALDRRIGLGQVTDSTSPPLRDILGVVADVRRSALSEAAEPTVYLPHTQSPTGANAFVVWGEGRPAELLQQAKRALWSVNGSIPVTAEASIGELVGASVRDRSFLLAILAGFATMALGLAAAGIFGLMSHSTGARTREIGVRMAFGAERGQVLGMVLRRGTWLAGLGVTVGLLGSLVTTRLLASRLYGVARLDPLTLIGAAAVLLATALVASWYPAWRASSVDPVRALHSE